MQLLMRFTPDVFMSYHNFTTTYADVSVLEKYTNIYFTVCVLVSK